MNQQLSNSQHMQRNSSGRHSGNDSRLFKYFNKFAWGYADENLKTIRPPDVPTLAGSGVEGGLEISWI